MTLNDELARRGADNIVAACLRVGAGEAVAICWWDVDELRALFEAAVARAGARARPIDLAPFAARAERGASREEIAAAVAPLLDGCAAALTVHAATPQPAVLFGVHDAAVRAGTRHVGLGMVDARLLAQGLRASPDVLETISARICEVLAAPCTVRVTSEAGTRLEVSLEPRFPPVLWSGRPGPGESQSLPTGGVSVHPASVDGTFVADRIVRFLGDDPVAGPALRRAPLRARLERGAVVGLECADAATLAAAERYLASHPNAARVGTVFFTANYLVRAETGMVRQDLLLPGMNLHLGLSSQRLTKAPFDAPVQANLSARRLNVDCGGRRIVVDGRLADALVAGVDPFR